MQEFQVKLSEFTFSDYFHRAISPMHRDRLFVFLSFLTRLFLYIVSSEYKEDVTVRACIVFRQNTFRLFR